MEPSGETAQIASQVATLDSGILEPHQERATLPQKPNYIRSPFISRIPPEALSRIFWFATRPDDEPCNKPLFRLRTVCSHWRRITESSPQLWTTLVLAQKLSQTATLATNYAGLVRCYCQHVGAATISVYISDLSHLPSTTIDGIVQILLKEHPGKLRSLHFLYLKVDTSVWPAILKYAEEDINFTSLEEFEQRGLPPWGNERKRRPQHVSIFCNSPRLRTLTLHGGSNIRIKFPWSQITTLDLSYFGLKYSLQLLTLCPNLINFETGFKDLNENLQAFSARQVTSIQSLRSLSWSQSDPNSASRKVKPADPITFTQFRFPSVRKLEWDAPLPSYAPHARAFFGNMQEVEELKFSPTGWQYSIDQHLDLFCHLTTLEADFTGYDEETPDWLYRLTIKQGKDNLFPHLQKLKMTTLNASMDRLIVVLHSRRNAPVDWSDPQQEPEKLEVILPPYDSTSPHWQSHSLLLEFSHEYYDSYEGADWTSSALYDELEDLIGEAIEAEGFDEDSCYARIVF